MTSTASKLDTRRHAVRGDLADTALRGHVEAARFVDGQIAQVAATAPMRVEPRDDAMLTTQILIGETVKVFDLAEGWAWVQKQTDAYVGYVPANALATGISFPTHIITAACALAFANPDLKTAPVARHYLGEQLVLGAKTGAYVKAPGGGYLHERTVAPVGTTADDAVTVAERFIGTPYLWGGKTAEGLDCSGLVQVALNATGTSCPRDSDMQEAEVGTSIGCDIANLILRRGDLVFWRGHVGFMCDDKTLLHANAWHMETAEEPLEEAVRRIAADGSPVTDIRRL
ncbi:MAG: NlpC/P60 family protein [Pseudomonadota bacterium]